MNASLRRRATIVFMVAVFLRPSAGRAGGGPRNVLVVVNQNAEESLEIGNYYVQRPGIPWANICRIATAPALSTTKAIYQAEIETPVMACIAASPYASRIDYIVLTRGLPVVASFPGGDVSVTALLQAMSTTLRGKDQEFGPPYGFQNYPSPYVGQREFFSHSKTFGGYNLYLAAMLSGYWSSDATALVDRSVASDGNPPTAAGGTFFLEDGVPAADVRNADFDAAAQVLQTLGYSASHVLLADPNVTGTVVASHVNSGSYSAISRADIDSNSYPAGCLVDVLESYGLTPSNFTPGLADQTPVTWWIAAGATGGHGTVSEPYNVAFPDAFMLEPYVDGYNLAETYYQGIPYLYWMNLVLGDPLAQPYARPPAVSVTAPAPAAQVSGPAVMLAVSATTPRPEGILRIECFVDDVQAGSITGASGQVAWNSLSVPDGWHRLEAVAFEDTARFTQATAAVDFRVDNTGRAITITSPPPGTRVSGTFPLTLAVGGSITDAAITAEGAVVGTGSGGPPSAIDVDTSGLGRGLHQLVATGSTGPAVIAVSARSSVYVVKPPRVNAFGPPLSGPQSGGSPVPIDGWNFEPDVEVRFGGRLASTVVRDANHLVVTSPTGPVGAVDVEIRNPLGLLETLPSAYTYTTSTCPATDALVGLRAARAPGGLLRMVWQPSSDPCHASYRVFSAADPTGPPSFPADYQDVTALDQDGDAGGDTSFLYPDPAAQLVYFRLASAGTDGTLGP